VYIEKQKRSPFGVLYAFDSYIAKGVSCFFLSIYKAVEGLPLGKVKVGSHFLYALYILLTLSIIGPVEHKNK
jgi:hypothetical protein